MHSLPSTEFTPGYAQWHLFPVSDCTKYTQAVCGGGGGVLRSVENHILQDLYTLYMTRFRQKSRKGGGPQTDNQL
jgi:hypothetical protein